MNSSTPPTGSALEPDGFVAVVEFPDGRFAAMPLRSDVAEAREDTFALVSAGVTVRRCAVVPVVSSAEKLATAIAAA